MSDILKTKIIVADGFAYRVDIVADCDMGAPWIEHDGHGVIRACRKARKNKAPGDVVIGDDWLYDVPATLKLAKRDGWGIGAEERAALGVNLGREPTASEVTAEAVRMDMERMKGWLNDAWQWIGVRVQKFDEAGDEMKGHDASLWGIESDSPSYHDEVARELIADIVSQWEGK